MTGLRLAGEKAGFALFSSVCFALLHFAQCVFCTFAETEVLGSCSVWRGGTHKGKKGENNGGQKGEDRDGDCWREEKQVLQFSATEVLGSCS